MSVLQVDDPSMPNDEGITALHNAVCAGHTEIVKFLVQFGVNVNAADSDGWWVWSPANIISSQSRSYSSDWLEQLTLVWEIWFKSPVFMNVVRLTRWCPPLLTAHTKLWLAWLLFLEMWTAVRVTKRSWDTRHLGSGWSVWTTMSNLSSFICRTPLHCAASCNNVQVCKFLVESGAAVFAATYSDMQTAADKCEEMEDGYAQCSQFLYGETKPTMNHAFKGVL